MPAYLSENDLRLLDEKMIKLLTEQNELLKERLKLEMQQNDMYRQELEAQRAIDEEADKIPF